MIKKVSTIAILAFSFNHSTFAETQSIVEVNAGKQQEVSWPGFVSQSFESQGLLCYEVIKTETYKNEKPKPKAFLNENRFISCDESDKDIAKSSNRYVTVTGKIIGTLDNDDYQYPVVMADKVRKWHYNYFDNTNVGTIKPRISRSRLDFLINNRGL